MIYPQCVRQILAQTTNVVRTIQLVVKMIGVEQASIKTLLLPQLFVDRTHALWMNVHAWQTQHALGSHLARQV